MRHQLFALATELAGLRERLHRNSRNSSKPPHRPVTASGSSRPQAARAVAAINRLQKRWSSCPRRLTGRKRGGQQGHPGSGHELLPIEPAAMWWTTITDACRRCGTLLHGDDPQPHRHYVIDIPSITARVIEHRLHRLICPCCGTSTCAVLLADVESSRYGPRLSALEGLLGSALPLSISKTHALLNQLLGVSIIRARRSAWLRQPVVSMDETCDPTCIADRANPDSLCGWLWVVVISVVTVFLQGLSRSVATAMELLGSAFAGSVVSDSFSAYNHLPIVQRQLCWAHLIRDLLELVPLEGWADRLGPAA